MTKGPANPNRYPRNAPIKGPTKDPIAPPISRIDIAFATLFG